METDAAVQAWIARLRTLLRDLSVIQARQYFDGSDVLLVASPQDHRVGQVLTRYIATVLLTSGDIRMVFKVHFDPDPIRSYRQARGVSEDKLDDEQLIDFMKELGNQMAGRVCRVFDAHHISMGMSVPLCTRGIYEIYADYQTKSGTVTQFGDFWRLEGAFQAIYCSCCVELTARHGLPAIEITDDPSEEGELDFL